MPALFFGLLVGIGLAALLTLLVGVYSVGPTQRGVITTFGRAQRLNGSTGEDPELGGLLSAEEKSRYNYPVVRVIPPGGPYFKWPWQRLYKVDMTIQTADITWDPQLKQSAAQVPAELKNRISHRGRALAVLQARLAKHA